VNAPIEASFIKSLDQILARSASVFPRIARRRPRTASPPLPPLPSLSLSLSLVFTPRRAISTRADDVYPIMHTSTSRSKRDRRDRRCRRTVAARRSINNSMMLSPPRSPRAIANRILERGSIDPAPLLHNAVARARVCMCVYRTGPV